MPTPANLYGSEDPSRTAKIERDKQDGAKQPADKLVARYWREIERYKRAADAWYQCADGIVDTYLREGRDAGATTRRFALLWSNVQTVQPSIYSRLPVIQCSRRWKDKDPIGRVAAELQERATNTTLELYGAHATFKYVRDDRLLAGRGQAWVRHEADLETYQEEDDDGNAATDDNGAPVYGERLKSRKVCVDYVHYRDFGHNVAPVWADVWLVWRCVYKTYEDIEERWGADKAKRLAYTHKPPASLSDGAAGNSDDQMEDCAKVYELWDKRRKLTSWMAEGQKEFLETGKPPLDFRECFPCPEPCYATKTSKRLIPTPDYQYYVDQAREINDLTDKIANLCEWLRVLAFIPAGPSSEGATAVGAMLQAIQDACVKGDSIFVPVESWTGWSEKGGASALIDWLPIEKVAMALREAISARNQLIQDVYQLMGVSDILRGQTDPDETLGAQQLKAQTGSRRSKETRDEMARWCRDIGALVAEVIADEYEPEQVAEITGYEYRPEQPVDMAGLGGLPGMPGSMPMDAAQPMPQPAVPALGAGVPSTAPGPAAAAPTTMPAPNAEPDSADELVFDDRHIALLRDDKLRSFRIDVETDSTAQPDEDAEKQRRLEFVDAVGTILEKAVPLVQAAPQLMPLVGETLKFTARGFRAGRQLEDVIDRTMDQLEQMAAQPKEDPEAAKVQAQAQAAQQKAELDRQIAEQKLMLEQQQAQAKMALEQAKLQAEMQLAQQKAELEARIAEMQAQHEAALAQQQMAVDAQRADMELQQAAVSAAADRELAAANANADREAQERTADMDRKLAAKNADADRKVKAKQQRAKP